MSAPVFDLLSPGRYAALRSALDAAQLPTDDLDEPDRKFFAASDQHGPIGYVGLEGGGADRLLRSLVVMPSRRGQGYGAYLLGRVEACAGAADVERLHLLTTTAAQFFSAHGYCTADRATAPAQVAASAQFASLCPASATYMTRTLDR